MAGVKRSGDGLDKLRMRLEGLGAAKVRVGFFPSATYEGGTPVAYVAAIQEFGDPSHSVPPRPFMRPTAESQRQEWADGVRQDASAVLKGELAPDQVMDRLGLAASGDIADTIRSISSPPISPITSVLRQWRRGGVPIGGKSVALAARLLDEGLASPAGGTADKPLVDSGVLLNAVSHEVEK